MAVSASTASTEGASTHKDVVRVAARAFEIDRYLAALLAPAAARTDLIALAAFAGEIARIPLFVTEPMMGRIRLQWWREAIENRADGGNPIASAIISAANRHQFDTSALIRLIDAHESTLEDAPFTDDQALAAYFDATEGVLFACGLQVLGAFTAGTLPDPDSYRLATRVYGMARLVAELPVTVAAGHVLIPRDRLSANHLDPTTVASAAAANTAAWQALLGDIRLETQRLHRYSAATLAALPRSHRAALYHLALVGPYLQASEMASKPGRAAIIPVQPWTRVWRLLWVRMTGRLGGQTGINGADATAAVSDAVKTGRS